MAPSSTKSSSIIPQDANAQALLDRFERITETEQHFIDLDRTVHFDKLGVNEVLLQMQVSWDRNRLVAPSSSCRCWTASPRTKAICTFRASARPAWPKPSANRRGLPQEKAQ